MEATRTIGGKFLSEKDRKALEKEQKQAREKKRTEKQARNRDALLAKLGMILGVALMIYLTLNGLMDQTWGTLFVAAGSAIVGYNMK